jgi:hypothetical protein
MSTTDIKKPHSEKVSMTLRVPVELKAWAESFAKESHMTVSDVFVLSVAESQRKGHIRVAPTGYKVEDIEDTPITVEKLAYYEDIIREHDALKAQGKVKQYDSVEYLHDALMSIWK